MSRIVCIGWRASLLWRNIISAPRLRLPDGSSDPIGRLVAPLRSNISIEDVGKTAIWLASDLSSAVTGEVVYVDGGFNILGVPLAEG